MHFLSGWRQGLGTCQQLSCSLRRGGGGGSDWMGLISIPSFGCAVFPATEPRQACSGCSSPSKVRNRPRRRAAGTWSWVRSETPEDLTSVSLPAVGTLRGSPAQRRWGGYASAGTSGLRCGENRSLSPSALYIRASWKRAIPRNGCIWRVSLKASVSSRHRRVRGDPSASGSPGSGCEPPLCTVRGWSEGDSRPVAVEAMRRGVAGAHPALSLRSEARPGSHPLLLTH